MLKGFKEFVLRGNVVDLAIGVVVGVAFGTVVSSFVKNLLTPLLAIPGKTDFGDLAFHVRKSTFAYGAFVNDLVAFLTTVTAVYFAIVLPMNRLAARRARGQAPVVKACPECLGEIPYDARRCMYCTSVVTG